MALTLFPQKDTPYKETKEYLDKQQKIDYMLVLAKLLEPGVDTNTDIKKAANKQIEKLLDEVK